MSRHVLASVVLATAAVLTACGQGSSSESIGTLESGLPALGPAPAPPLDIRATVSEPSYRPGDTVHVNFTFTNTSENQVTVSRFPPRIEFIRPLELQPVRSYPEGSTEGVLNPGESLQHSLTWDQRDTNGRPVPPGKYYVQVAQMPTSEGSWGLMSSGNTPGMDKILIQYPQGALTAPLEPGLTVSANGVLVTLDRVEFSASATQVYTSVVPPGYLNPDAAPDDPNRPVMPPMAVMPFNPSATYSVDSQSVVYAGSGGFRPREKDLLVTCDLNPLPADAREFTFTLDSIGRWDGPWEFRLQLTPTD